MQCEVKRKEIKFHTIRRSPEKWPGPHDAASFYTIWPSDER